jgi:hypothetical protein
MSRRGRKGCVVAILSLGCRVSAELSRQVMANSSMVVIDAGNLCDHTNFSLEYNESRLEGGVNRANLKFTNLSTTTSRVSVRSMNESEREGEKQIASK